MCVCVCVCVRVCVVSCNVNVAFMAKDETHDVEVALDNDAGLLRMLITTSDRCRPRDDDDDDVGRRRPNDHGAALANYTVRSTRYYKQSTSGPQPAH